MRIKKFKIKEKILLEYNGKDECVVIPNGVEEIGYKSFEHNEKIKTVIFPNSVKKICMNAFFGCTSLENIKFNEGLRSIGDYAFCFNSNLKIIEFPESLVKIENGAFEDCGNLEKVKFNKNLRYIGTRAFSHCESLKNVFVPRKVKLEKAVFPHSDIGEFVFEGNKYKIVDNCLYTKNGKTLLMSFAGNEINVLDGTKKIQNWALAQKKKITIPKSLKDFGNYHNLNEGVEFNTKSLRFVKIGNCIYDTKKKRLVQSWGNNNIAIDGIKIIGEDSLAFLCNTPTISLCEGIIKIEKGALALNVNTREFTVPSTVKSIGINAFEMALKLEKIILKNGVRKIDFTYFINVHYPKLRYIQIPSSVKQINGYDEGMKNLTIICEKGSHAYKYAQKHNLKYELISNQRSDWHDR